MPEKREVGPLTEHRHQSHEISSPWRCINRQSSVKSSKGEETHTWLFTRTKARGTEYTIVLTSEMPMPLIVALSSRTHKTGPISPASC